MEALYKARCRTPYLSVHIEIGTLEAAGKPGETIPQTSITNGRKISSPRDLALINHRIIDVTVRTGRVKSIGINRIQR